MITYSFRRESFAPFLIKSLTTSKCPLWLAFISGVFLLRQNNEMHFNQVGQKSFKPLIVFVIYYNKISQCYSSHFVECVNITASCKKNIASPHVTDESRKMK
jgi:hypothetical protein